MVHIFDIDIECSNLCHRSGNANQKPGEGHMKRFKLYHQWTIGLAISLVLAHPATARAILNHDLVIQLHPSEHGLKAKDIITVPPGQRSFMLFEMADHLTVQSVTIDRREVPFSFNGGRLRIALSPDSDSRQVGIYYSGVYNDAMPVEPLNTDNPGYGITGTIDPRGTMLLAGAKWYPDSIGAASQYTLTVDAPEGVVAVTAGRPLGHATQNGQTRSRWSVDHPVRGLPLVAGPYAVSVRRFGDIRAATYFSQPLQHLSDSYLNATGRYLQLYQELFGPYPYGQFAVVENFFPTGYGFPSFTLLGRRVLRLPFIIHTSLGHEIAHCWWGNGVLVDASQGNWSEGLTSYVADYLYKERHGQGRDHRRQWLRNYASLVDDSNDFPAARFMSRVDPVTKVVGYDKVAMVFHMLRQSVGDDAFWQTLREI
jgi:aminopeptidase N